MSEDAGERAGEAAGPRDEWRLLYAVVVVAAAGLLAFSVRSVLSPVVLYFVLLALLRPYAGTRGHATILTVATVLLAIWLLTELGGLLAPFVLAFALAYILDPAVDRLEGRRVARGLAIAMLAVPVLAGVALLIGFGVPAIAGQVEGLIEQTPQALQRISDWAAALRTRLGTVRIPFLPEFDPLQDIALLNPDRLAEMIRQRQSSLLEGGAAAILGVGRGVGVVVAVLGYVVLTPVVLFYLLRDFDRIRTRAVNLVPPARRERWLAFLREYDRLLSRFLRGQVVAAAIVGVLTWLGLWLVGFPYPAVVGMTAGVFNLVPYLGLLVSVIPVVVISLVTGNVLVSLLKAGLVFAVVQFIDGSVTGPRIVGESVGLHPVWVMLALAVGGFFFGFVGLLLAMPAAVLIKLWAGVALEAYRSSKLYNEPPARGEA